MQRVDYSARHRPLIRFCINCKYQDITLIKG